MFFLFKKKQKAKEKKRLERLAARFNLINVKQATHLSHGKKTYIYIYVYKQLLFMGTNTVNVNRERIVLPSFEQTCFFRRGKSCKPTE